MIKNKKISKSFIGFLVASFFIWLLITLSKEYTAIISYPVQYNNIPQDKLLQKEPTKEIDVIVKSSGFNIIKSRFSNYPIILNAKNLNRKTSSKYYFLTKNQKNNIQSQLYSGVELQQVILDTIYLEIGSLISKKVPLKPNLDINYHIGYDVLETVKINPDTILISGPEAQINKISKIDLELLKLNDVKSDFEKQVKIVLPENANNLKVKLKTATISGKVEKFTEGTLDIRFKIINLPKEIELTTLNNTVEVVFVVGLSNFNKVDKNSFEVICDYHISKENNLSYLLPKIVTKPSFIKSIKVVPSKIDFLIQK
ncbi:CdaR family protein [uncultured Polaribacter sp.]|uniref:CdaR family protein n=1 Tax=uncultured Polaribacter sp. TaxID=174711 RepID=UPI00260A5E09|nr:CdaR family protein [uncultured Polaribacter sp.]